MLVIGIAVIAAFTLACPIRKRESQAVAAGRQQIFSGGGVEDNAAPLREAWYYAVARPTARTAARHAGQDDARRAVADRPRCRRRRFALRDICPHRGMPLSAGNFDGLGSSAAITAGASTPAVGAWRSRRWCRARPSRPSRVQVRCYPACEVKGNIWVFFGDDPAAAPGGPAIGGVRGRRARSRREASASPRPSITPSSG